VKARPVVALKSRSAASLSYPVARADSHTGLPTAYAAMVLPQMNGAE